MHCHASSIKPPVHFHELLFVNSEALYGRLLAPYLEDPAHVFIVSSDFCHWGTRFNYVFYDRSRARPSLTPS